MRLDDLLKTRLHLIISDGRRMLRSSCQKLSKANITTKRREILKIFGSFFITFASDLTTKNKVIEHIAVLGILQSHSQPSEPANTLS